MIICFEACSEMSLLKESFLRDVCANYFFNKKVEYLSRVHGVGLLFSAWNLNPLGIKYILAGVLVWVCCWCSYGGVSFNYMNFGSRIWNSRYTAKHISQNIMCNKTWMYSFYFKDTCSCKWYLYCVNHYSR